MIIPDKTNKTSNPELIKLGNKINRLLSKYEVFLGLAALGGILMKMYALTGAGILVTLCFGTLSVIYYFRAFAFIEDEEMGPMDRFADKIVSLASSAAIVGLLFRLQSWPGYKTMLTVGCGSLALGLLFIINTIKNKPGIVIFNRQLMLRIIIILCIGFGLLFSSSETLEKIGLIKPPAEINQ